MNASTLTTKANKLGYTVIIDEGKVQYIYPTERSSYTPEIYGGRDMFGEVTPWTIQTAGYGTLPVETITHVINGFERAQKMVALLEEFTA